ncbi:FAD/NAD(P)-binding protein [Leeuwenhoekiella aestuarii]|uniref:FAD-NAD(P)-binding protein n=1 Tax=Leeuwenhoekiella aestuarii TaxID=2249426 RepID=A0A4Q0NT17_9FLAO|nr:FAD/NAD(P)-binding protein [Leeuwenhoekiella aestuarii]RXG13287.1 FAD-NAD(P)-binding protein [Leeuwenhoekiella aestuarii]
MDTSVFNVGIIGLGPKGFYGFERLLAEIDQLDDHTDMCIHLFNESDAFATGWVYDINQPEYLLMNYPNKYISSVPRTECDAMIPMSSYSEWVSKFTGNSISYEEKQIAPRAAVGRYLKYYFNLLLKAGSSRVKIKKHITTVTAIKKGDSGFYIDTTTGAGAGLTFKTLLLTTGHSPAISSAYQTASNCDYTIPFVYPFDKKLTPVKSGTTVLCKGIGLTAIDTILGLTEGRDGAFKKSESGSYSYTKSGTEPFKIMPFSRSGIPIIPRGLAAINLKQTSFFLKHLVENTLKNKRILDFEKQVLPILKVDIEAEYYHRLFKHYHYEYTPSVSIEHFRNVQKDFHKRFPKVNQFKAQSILYPKLNPESNLQQAVKNFWEFWIIESEKKESPYAAAVAAWRFAAEDFNRLYSANVLTPASRSIFQNKYFGLFNRVAYGPPVQNIQKMLALMQAGILDFSYAKSPQLIEKRDACYLQTKTQKIEMDYILDARLPRGFSKEAAVLFNPIAKPALFSHTANLNAVEVKCTRQGHPVDASGAIEKNMVLYGTPTEGALFDNDTLSRTHNDTASMWAKNTVIQYIQSKTALTT